MSLTTHGFQLVDSTLREGEQFAKAHFTSAQRLRIAAALDDFGIDYIEMTNPLSSPASAADLARVAATAKQAKILTHVRCRMEDVQLAVDCGVSGVNLLFGSSKYLRHHSHGRDIAGILKDAEAVVTYLRDHHVEVRFSCEDAFRTPFADLARIHMAVAAMGVDRIGVADTVGIAAPNEVEKVVSRLRDLVDCDIEFHGHNDSGCAVANAYTAYQAGATHLDVTIMGIAPLTGLIARLWLKEPEIARRYKLSMLTELDELVAGIIGVEVPFNACISSPHAFSHKAGMHTKAVLAEP